MKQGILKTCVVLSVFYAVCGQALAEKFTIAVIPDTQNYSDNAKAQPASSQVFNRETQFIADNKDSKNIVFVSHVGDVVQNYGTYSAEWTRAVNAMTTISNANIPMGMVPGNHDYDKSLTGGKVDGSNNWNANFGPSSSFFNGKSWYGGAYINSTSTSGMSSWQTFSAGKWTFLHLALEQEPSDSVLSWAQSVIDAHPQCPVIVSTHEYINYNGGYVADNYRNGFPRNTPAEVWNEFIKTNSQIFSVLCGHNFNGAVGPASRRTDLNADGTEVYQLLSDYQGTKTSTASNVGTGGGWIRLMEFDTLANSIHVQTYSTELNKYSTDPALTDGSAFAKTWAPFNYVNGTGALLASSNIASSDFYITCDFNTRLVPEPATLALLAIGVMGLIRRRK